MQIDLCGYRVEAPEDVVLQWHSYPCGRWELVATSVERAAKPLIAADNPSGDEKHALLKQGVAQVIGEGGRPHYFPFDSDALKFRYCTDLLYQDGLRQAMNNLRAHTVDQKLKELLDDVDEAMEPLRKYLRYSHLFRKSHQCDHPECDGS